jgi:hypothetical protein
LIPSQADKEQIKSLQKKLEEMSKLAADDKEKKMAAKYPQVPIAKTQSPDKFIVHVQLERRSVTTWFEN